MRVGVLCLLSWAIVGVGTYKTQPEGRIHNVTEDASEATRDVIERAAELGLRASEHAVRTEDGHVLCLIRVRGTDTKAGVGPPILLMHGLLQSAGAWLNAGHAALATLLAAAGRDLWLGNARGSHYSRQHAWLHPDKDALFWRFSADEMGRYDLPALLDYILASTGATKLDYVGYSQGGAVFLIMCSELPHYCDKVNLNIALAPAARLERITSLAKFAVEYITKNYAELNELGIWEMLPREGLIHSVSETLCNLPKRGLELCEIIKSLYDSPHPGSITRSTYLAAAAGFPAGTSVHNIARYGQNIRSKRFQKFDYGPKQNLVLYGNETAPTYDLSTVTVPTVLIYAKHDRLVDASNIRWLQKTLPNVVEVFEVPDPMWSHMDFTMSRNVPKYVYPIIKKYLDKHSYK